jgi:GTP cyclohydrolase II
MDQKIKRVVSVNLPTFDGEFDFIAYSNGANEAMPHLALVARGTDFTNTVNVRIHSECLTGDVFGSKRCECGEQLHLAMKYITEYGGVMIYLRQEGRGIGLINKLHAYVKQDQGFDTAEANVALGFEYDERSYEEAISILNDLKIKHINILTNNPAKIASIEKSNIEIMSRIKIEAKPSNENKKYLRTKKEKFGHLLDEV